MTEWTNLAAWSIPLLYAAGALLVLEVIYLVLRRVLPEFNVRFVYHVWCVAVALLLMLAAAGVDRGTLHWKLTATTAAVLSAWVAFALLSAAIIKRPWTPEKPFLPKLARDVLRIGLLIAVGLAAANLIVGVDLRAIVVSSTVLSAVAGLALQDVLRNFFAGMALDLEKPFTRGDWLLLDDAPEAEVIDLGWRTVHLRTREGVDIREPNTRLSGARLLNYGSGREPKALAFRIGLPHDIPPADAKRALAAAARSVPETLPAPPVEVMVEGFREDSVGYHLRAWTGNVSAIDHFRDAVYSRIWHEFKRRGLDVSLPTRDVQIQSARAIAAERDQDTRRRAVKRLVRLDLFAELNPDIIRTLAEGAHERHFDIGEVLVRESEAGDSLFVIESGSVAISKVPDQGDSEVDVGRLEEGDFFGEQSLLTGEPRNATVRTEDGCTVLEIAKPLLAKVLAADPEIAETLSRALAARNEITAASLERYRERRRDRHELENPESILRRMRVFFGLKN